MTGALQSTAVRWRAANRACVVVEVSAARGSVPRDAGTRMLVAADEVVGTIGGGHLELCAIADARRLLAGDGTVARTQQVALGPSLGQCCGGAVALRFTDLRADDPAAWPLPPPRFVLELYGAGHVGRAIVQLLQRLPCRVRWIDEREAEFPPWPLPPHIERVCAEPVEAEVALAPPGALFLVLTHSHALDLALAHAILLRHPGVGFFGLIGSRTKRARFEHRLHERGIGDAALARMTCPIGLPGIAGKEPEIVALAAVAQLLQHAAGSGSGSGAA